MVCALQWVNLCLELPSLISELFPGHTHKSLESLVVGGACQLRRVFTLRDRPSGSQDGSLISGGGDIPKACQMTVDHTPIPTQVIRSTQDEVLRYFVPFLPSGLGVWRIMSQDTCVTCYLFQVMSSVTNSNQPQGAAKSGDILSGDDYNTYYIPSLLPLSLSLSLQLLLLEANHRLLRAPGNSND